MRATGIVRRVDELGRIVIPKSIREQLNIETGQLMEIFIDKNSCSVVFTIYKTDNEMMLGESLF